MSGETSLKFIIPESSCQKDFEVWALFADGAKESVLRCDWVDMYHCDSAPGYTHTLENSTALITLPRDLEKKPDNFICDYLFRPKTDPSSCLCQRVEFIPLQPDSDSPGQVALIAGVSAISFLVFVVLVGFLIYKCCCRPNSSESNPDLNGRPDECKPLKDPNSHLNSPNPLMPPPIAFSRLNKETSEAFSQSSPAIEETRPQNGEPRMDVPQISATDSQESSTPTLTAPPTETVPPKMETKIQLSHPEPA